LLHNLVDLVGQAADEETGRGHGHLIGVTVASQRRSTGTPPVVVTAAPGRWYPSLRKPPRVATVGHAGGGPGRAPASQVRPASE